MTLICAVPLFVDPRLRRATSDKVVGCKGVRRGERQTGALFDACRGEHRYTGKHRYTAPNSVLGTSIATTSF